VFVPTTVSSGNERSPCVALRVRLVVCDGEGQGLVVRAAENCAVSDVSQSHAANFSFTFHSAMGNSIVQLHAAALR
jgi:hypothetical protein